MKSHSYNKIFNFTKKKYCKPIANTCYLQQTLRRFSNYAHESFRDWKSFALTSWLVQTTCKVDITPATSGFRRDKWVRKIIEQILQNYKVEVEMILPFF